MNGLLDRKVGEFTAAEYEEMTDVAERISAPMDHPISFQNIDGKLYTESSVDGDDLLTISRNAEKAALAIARQNPQWTVEAYRRSIESQEVLQATSLPVGAKMIVASPTPDVALSGAVNIGGYNLEKKTTMVRVWENTGQTLGCRYISLDGGNRQALQVAMQSVGRDIPDEFDSEQILATFYTFLDEDRDLGDLLVNNYDSEMERQTGEIHSYGRPGLTHDSKKALEIAMENPDRLRDHMEEVARLKWAYSGDELKDKLEEARYNYAAALEKVNKGGIVTSNGAAGGEARASGANFSGYCATTPDNAQSTEEAYNSMFAGKRVTGKCPCCHEITSYDPCDPVCGVCGSTGSVDRSAEYFAKKKAEKEKQSAEAYKKDRESMSRSDKRGEFGRKAMAMIKKFVWGDGAFSPVEEVLGYHGEIIAEGADAQQLYKEYYGIGY